MQHHLSFAAFVCTSIALQLHIPNTFGGTEGTVSLPHTQAARLRPSRTT